MPVLIGVLFGRLFMRIAFSRAVLTLVLWAAVYGCGENLGVRLFGRGAGWIGGVLACAALLTWSLWRPAASRARIWMLEGVYLWLRLALVAALAMAALSLLGGRGGAGVWSREVLPFSCVAIAAWAAQRWLARLIVRSGWWDDGPGASP